MSALLDTLLTMQVIERPEDFAEIMSNNTASPRPDKAAPTKKSGGKGRRS